jgi:hypothetical protein
MIAETVAMLDNNVMYNGFLECKGVMKKPEKVVFF